MEEKFIFENKYNLYLIYNKNGLNETLFYFNNKLLNKFLEEKMKTVPKLYFYKKFSKEFISFIFIGLLLFFFMLDYTLGTSSIGALLDRTLNFYVNYAFDGYTTVGSFALGEGDLTSSLPPSVTGEQLFYDNFMSNYGTTEPWSWF